ncbi:MAG: Hydrolase, alpha/beta fold family [uncultured Nocardioidaceae bacterium]|uniref:Hydrolase, alpha/beta fold family n=1 Tax=uncultured Nocardioidaceae bacterium TaxID=253824 RepID=A0A6J4NX98_9ACTN|nr:MAG: Hydrolase, alpha/beta fold family [uncultured Nocardioidaceae bacterium]
MSRDAAADAPADTAASQEGRESADSSLPEEQTAHLPHGIDLCYQAFGDPSDRPLLLVMGLGGPMTWWPVDLCRRLAAEGFFVIRYDNRDTGRSTRLRQHRVSQRELVRAFLGRRVDVPYSLRDMAQDAVALLDHLDIEAAHVAGVSMGGMIAQSIAIDHPERVLSLTSIMSTTGNRKKGFQHPMLLPAMLRRPISTEEEYVEGSVKFSKIIGSPGYPEDDDAVRARAHETWSRGVNFKDTMRHMLAVVTQRDRTAGLRQLKVPATVVHGRNDKMVHVSGGRATASAIPGTRLVLVPGMGHNLPSGIFDILVDAITEVADRAARKGS